jgi:hypothetical protein
MRVSEKTVLLGNRVYKRPSHLMVALGSVRGRRTVPANFRTSSLLQHQCYQKVESPVDDHSGTQRWAEDSEHLQGLILQTHSSASH